MIDITTRNSQGFKEILPGVRSWGITVAGLVAYDDAAGFMTLLQGPINKAVFSVKFTTGIATDFFLSGNAYVTTISQTAPDNGVSKFTSSLEGTGALTVGSNV